jgi:protein-S-isoprenylcysteine O-methyltransferase Ste14
MFELFLFYLAFFFCALVWPSVRVWRQTGRNPIVLPNSDDVAGFVGLIFKLLIILLGLYLSVGAIEAIQPIGAIALPRIAQKFGWALLIGSIIWVIVAQYQMGRSWRVGIDTTVETELVATGLFRFSRNPIFLGMLVQLIGFFLVQSDALTASITLSAYILISVQIRGEEDHLSRMHGNEYLRYKKAVRRWI